ncbi:hypothetical protein [Adhaeribacter terreus]|uniref:Lipoprotein n=1 Tax=Adhaeribacter terreus TaxID=529703 RepID=A0ABW0EC76_9BACT
MQSIRFNFLAFFLIFFLIGCQQNTATSKMQYADSKYKEGQIWAYKTRSNEKESFLTILKVEKEAEGIIIHIAVDSAKIKNPNLKVGYSSSIGHLPFSKEALNKSVTMLISNKNELPNYLDGYQEWRQAYNKGEAGVFSITVAEAVAYVEETMNK